MGTKDWGQSAENLLTNIKPNNTVLLDCHKEVHSEKCNIWFKKMHEGGIYIAKMLILYALDGFLANLFTQKNFPNIKLIILAACNESLKISFYSEKKYKRHLHTQLLSWFIDIERQLRHNKYTLNKSHFVVLLEVILSVFRT